MPEIKHNFTGGKMNKDLDERLVPNGEYRDAMNIQVSTSEGSDVGTVQNILGNTLITGQEFIPSTASCVGSIADEKNDKLYYFIVDGETANNPGYIIEYNSVTDTITPVLVDLTGDVLKFSSKRLVTGVNIIDDLLFFTDNHSEPKKINISRCIEGTDPAGLTRTKLINESRDINVGSNIDLEEKHITVIRKSPTTAPAIELISGQDDTFAYSGVMRITSDPGGLIQGADNTQNASSMWFDTWSNFNHLHDFSELAVGDEFRTKIETDINGESGFTLDWNVGDTVVFKEFSGDTYDEAPPTPITDYTLKAKIVQDNNNQFQDSVTEVAPNGNFALPNIDGTRPLGYSWSNANVNNITYDSINSKVTVDTVTSYQIVASATPSTPFATGTAAQAGTYRITYEIQGIVTGSKVYMVIVSPSSGSYPTYWSTPIATSNGIHTHDLTLEDSLGSNFTNFSYASGKFFVRTADWGGTGAAAHEFELLNISIERQDASDAGVKLEVLGINSVPATVPSGYSELRYAVELLDEEENLFEFKFPRFAYRYQYEDKEYSTFSPFTQVAFLPGSFDYHPQKGYNLGMTNRLKEIKLKNFIPADGVVDDVIAVDILYKDEASPNIYVIDTIKNNQYSSDIWLNNEYTIKSEAVKRILPSNQLLRPWDSVPKKALAQEISGNRIIYANYTQGFDLLQPGTNQEYYPDFNFNIISDTIGLNTVKSIKSLREYQLGVVFIDKYGRETPVLSNSSGLDKIPKIEAAKSNKIEVSFGDTVFPENMKYFKFFVKETSGEYYNMTMDRWWDAGDGLAWISFGSADINKIDIDTFLILKKGIESNDLITDPARYKVLAIETEAPDYIKTKKTLIEEKTHEFSNATENVFGNTTDDVPLLGRDTFKLRYQPFVSGPGSEIHNIEDGVLYIEFAIGSVTSKRYRITELTQPQNPINDATYNIQIDKTLGDDINFICDDPNGGLNATKIIDGTIVRIYKYTPENSSEFDGRFFVKVINDEVFTYNMTDFSVGTVEYRTTLSKKLYYMGSDQAALHSEVLTGQTLGIYQDAAIVQDVFSSGSASYVSTTFTNQNNFGRFAPFFRNYKYSNSSSQLNSTAGGLDIGQYRFDSTTNAEWQGEFRYHTASDAYPWNNWSGWASSSGSTSFPLKNADDSGFSDNERYGVFNSDGEQEKGNVWFIDAGPFSGSRWAPNVSLGWNALGDNNSFENGIVNGSMTIAMGGIYNDGEAVNSNVSNVFNIGSADNSFYNSQKFKDLVGKISPSVKFRFKEDPTGEVYTINPSGVTYKNRLRWSDGDQMPNSSGEYPAYAPIGSTSDIALAPQLSPNITRGYKATFTNDRTNDTQLTWDPTNGGVTGAIQQGLNLTAIHSQTPTSTTGYLPMVKVSVNDIHDLTCSVNGGKHSIAKGMILTSYGGTTLDGVFNNPEGNATNSGFSHEPLIVESITGSGPYSLYLTGYSSPILNSNLANTSLLKHKIFDTAPTSTESMVFQQPAMNGYSQYSVNRINQQDANGDGSSLSTPALLAVGYTIQFLEEIETESEFPDNPAIWETEPKETTPLDIYYEASGYNPLVLTEETKYLAIPIGSLVECVENPAATLVNMTVNSVDYAPLPSTLAVGQSGTGPWRLSLATKFTQDEPLVGGDFITIGRHLKITKPDGSIITVEVTGWDASAGFSGSYPVRTPFIYINEVLHGPDTKYILNWHNCYSFGNGVESNRIRDTFNLPFIANGVKASTTLDENPYEEQLKYGLIYSGIYNSNSSINNLNQFIAAEKITKDINPIYGSIQKLKAGWGQGGDLITLCEDRVLKILANKDALFNADGNTNLTSTNNVLGQAIPYSGEYGISKNPESFASEAYRAYFTDKVRGAVMRLSMDGLTPISNAGMKDFFNDTLKLSNKLIGSYDDRKDEYNLTLQVSGIGLNIVDTAKATSISSGFTVVNDNTVIWDNTGVTDNLSYFNNAMDIDDIVQGKKYRLTLKVSNYVGAGTSGVSTNGGVSTSAQLSSNGTYIEDFIATGDRLDFFGKNTNSCTMELTVRELEPGKTVSYKENTKGFVSFKSFIPENALSTASNYYTVFGGKLYKHHVESADRNTFYNTFTNSSVNVLLNDMPSAIKSYRTLEYEGSQSRVIQNLDDDEYYNLTDKDGWYVSSIETDKKKGSLLEFIEKEGKWFNYIKGIESNVDKTTDFASFNIQGLGTIQSIDNNDITIDGDLNVSLQIEDVVYFNSTQIEIAGKVTAINDNTITVDNSGTLPSQGDYIFFVKNQMVNMSKLSGYYANAKFENDSKVKAELYAVSSEITQSSK